MFNTTEERNFGADKVLFWHELVEELCQFLAAAQCDVGAPRRLDVQFAWITGAMMATFLVMVPQFGSCRYAADSFYRQTGIRTLFKLCVYIRVLPVQKLGRSVCDIKSDPCDL